MAGWRFKWDTPGSRKHKQLPDMRAALGSELPLPGPPAPCPLAPGAIDQGASRNANKPAADFRPATVPLVLNHKKFITHPHPTGRLALNQTLGITPPHPQ